MNLRELRERFWWTLDNGQNIEDLTFLYDGSDVKLINDALRDLADCLNIIKADHTLAPNVSGAVVLPDDWLALVYAKWGSDIELKPVESVREAQRLLGSGTVSKYMISGGAMQLYDVPVLPYQTLYLWYQAYPLALADDDDIPSDVPGEYHDAIVTLFCRAQFFRKLGDFNQYTVLMDQWQRVKQEIREVINLRTKPVEADTSWKW